MEDLKAEHQQALESALEKAAANLDADEQIRVLEAEYSQSIKDLKMAHERDIAKLNKDHRENTERVVEQLRKDLAELRTKHEELLKEKEDLLSASSA